jgi:predicted tellurium resistance membrane protein TerC
VLGFVGVKLLAQGAGYDVGTGISLSVVAIVLSLGIGLSVIDKGKKAEEA